jgi:energy-coupling factor transporter ATP-binding protein EcfA2
MLQAVWNLDIIRVLFVCSLLQALDRAMQPSDGAHPRTVLVIAHRLSTVRNAHSIVVLDKGKVSTHLHFTCFIKKGQIHCYAVRFDAPLSIFSRSPFVNRCNIQAI